jgi:hypothetical protein
VVKPLWVFTVITVNGGTVPTVSVIFGRNSLGRGNFLVLPGLPGGCRT